MKHFFYVMLSLCSCSIIASAQDVIVKKDGTTILSKVLEVNIVDIKYKKFSNQNGPTYTINKSEILSINYENGEKDSFKEGNIEASAKSNTSSQRLTKKTTDSRNTEIISLYNQQHELINIRVKKSKNPLAKHVLPILGIRTSSTMSNEDIEMTFVLDRIEDPNNHYKYPIYYINLKNKTDKTIHIDKGNCFRLYNDGTFHCYYDNTEQTTINLGGASGGSLGLGSVTGALGIGGFIGQLANGVNIGGDSSHSVSTTYSQQRVITIPPHGNRNLTDEKWVKTKNGGILNEAAYTIVEEAEDFRIEESMYSYIHNKYSGIVNKGQILVFNENEIPWKREYIITYSTEEDFKTYSSINSELYIREIIGAFKGVKPDNLGKDFKGINKYTLNPFHYIKNN